jgi:serine/threonine protein kinase
MRKHVEIVFQLDGSDISPVRLDPGDASVYTSTSLKNLVGKLGFVKHLCDHKDMEEQQFFIKYYVSVDCCPTEHQILCWSTFCTNAFSNALSSMSCWGEFDSYFTYLGCAELCAMHLKLFDRVVHHFVRYMPHDKVSVNGDVKQPVARAQENESSYSSQNSGGSSNSTQYDEGRTTNSSTRSSSAQNERTRISSSEPTEPLEFSKLKFGEILGRGGFAVVHRAFYDGFCVAVKQLTPVNEEERSMVDREIELHRRFQCRTLLKIYGACESEDGVNVYLVLEYARYTSLKAVYLKTRVTAHECKNSMGVDVSLKRRVQWLKDVIEAVSYLHQHNVLHRDIKCENVLLHEDMRALLGDLGLSKELSSSRARSQGVGTSVFRAPETDSIYGYKFPADVYSFGITIMELLLSSKPCDRTCGLQDMQSLGETCPELAFQLENLRRIAEHCTLRMPDDRPCATQVLQWLNNDWHSAEVPEIRSVPLLIESHIDMPKGGMIMAMVLRELQRYRATQQDDSKRAQQSTETETQRETETLDEAFSQHSREPLATLSDAHILLRRLRSCASWDGLQCARDNLIEALDNFCTHIEEDPDYALVRDIRQRLFQAREELRKSKEVTRRRVAFVGGVKVGLVLERTYRSCIRPM